MLTEKLTDKSIFNVAREIDSADERRTYLQQACGSDLAQFDRVTDLLSRFESNSQFLESPLHCQQPTALTNATACRVALALEHPGTQIGTYTIREQLGEGGMGVVYIAEQKEPVRRKVALKIIKPGMDSAEVLARFDAERQALAMMSHPNIAKIFDGGTTETGRPYFVMELVKGVPITEYCNAQQFNVRERLKLFIIVCNAVQHAHIKGIIHRDLKPSNVLVELHDVASIPKVIDFGVAKAISQPLTTQTIYTHYSQLLGTPLYMSPEQAELSGLDIDTRSDIYSLGVMLYELLAGVPPFGKATLHRVGLDEWRRIVCEDEPLRPSNRISTLDSELQSTISRQRKASPRDLSLSIRRELDWIVMKTLEKDRERRYESANEFAADIQRFLDNEPVKAFPPSPTYRLKKFAHKHMTGIVATCLVALALIAGTSVSVWQAREANAARELADRRFIEADAQRRNAILAVEKARLNEEVSRQLVYAADVNLAARAWESGDVHRFTSLLDQHRPIEDQVDRRGFEWMYLRQFARADYHNIAVLTGGTSVVRFSPDSKYLVTGQTNGLMYFWDGQTETLLAMRLGHQGLVRGVDFSPDGTHLASIGDDGVIRLWDLSKQQQIHSFQAHQNHGFRVFYVNEGKVLASCGEDASVRLWDASTGKSLGELKDYARTVERATMNRSPQGRYCVSGDSSGMTFVWDTKTNKRLCQLDLGLNEGVHCRGCCVCFSPNGRLVAAGTNQHLIRICDAKSGKQIETLIGHDDDLQDVTFHPSGRLLTSCDIAGVIRTWPLTADGSLDEQGVLGTARWPSSFHAHSARIWALDFSPDGNRLISASKDGMVRSWSGRTPAQQRVTETGDQANAMAFSVDQNEIFIAGKRNLRVWNRRNEETRTFENHFDHPADCVAISPDGLTCATGHADGMIRYWSCETGQLTKETKGHESELTKLAFSADGQWLATGGWDGKAIIWNAKSGEQQDVFEMFPHCYDIAFSPDSRLLACSSENDAMIYDISIKQRLRLLQGHYNSAECVAFSPDGRLLATGSADRTVRIWNVATGESEHPIAAHSDEIQSICFSPDGKTIVSGGSRGTLAFTHVQTGRLLLETKVGADQVNCLEFSQDGGSLAAAVHGEGVLLLHAPRISTKTLN